MSEESRRNQQNASDNELKEALGRLEKAVENLAVTAKDELADRATAFIEETTQRLESEFATRRDRARDRAHREPLVAEEPPRSPGLYRDIHNEKIAGVCAGLANYWQMEAWVVRCIAVTGLLFMPQLVFPAYWIMYFVMGRAPEDQLRSGKFEDRNVVLAADLRMNKDKRKDKKGKGKRRQNEPPKPSPRAQYRSVQSVLNQAELRLRRMETHVTSGRYELQREIAKLDDGATAK